MNTDSTVGSVVLAAGTSSRFGAANKLLADLDGEAVLAHVVRTLRQAEVAGPVVVVGHEASAIRDALDSSVTVRDNPRYEAGQHTSVRAGVAVARERDWDAVVVALGDMPFVASATIDALCRAYAAGRGTILAPAHKGQRGNPVLFDAAHFDALAAVSGDRGGRQLVETHPDAALVPVDDPGVLRDIDRRADLPDDWSR